MLNQLDKPEDMLRLFTRSAIWDGWNELSALEKTELKKQLGPMLPTLY